MAIHQIKLTPAVRRSLDCLPRPILKRIHTKISGLRDNPRPHDAKKLRCEEGFLRVRVGDYRIVYGIEDDQLIVLIVRIGHRRDVYRGL